MRPSSGTSESHAADFRRHCGLIHVSSLSSARTAPRTNRPTLTSRRAGDVSILQHLRCRPRLDAIKAKGVPPGSATCRRFSQMNSATLGGFAVDLCRARPQQSWAILQGAFIRSTFCPGFSRRRYLRRAAGLTWLRRERDRRPFGPIVCLRTDIPLAQAVEHPAGPSISRKGPSFLRMANS